MTRPGRDSAPGGKPPKGANQIANQIIGCSATPDYNSEIVNMEVLPRIRAGRSLIDAAQSHRLDGETALQGTADILERAEHWFVVAQHPSSESIHSDASELVGAQAIAQRLNVADNTPVMWRARGLLPAPKVIVSNIPMWSWETIKAWAEKTGRLAS